MRVALISTSRSDRGHYAPLERLLRADPRFDLDSYELDAAVVLGDRVEMLQAAVNLVERRVPLLHIHGGEHTLGSLDERWRWAITMIADKHCVATEEAQFEVDKHILGDAKPGFTDAYRKLSMKTFVTGAPGLDGITKRNAVTTDAQIVVHYNSALDAETTRREWSAICQAMREPGPPSIVIIPNGDRFSNEIDQSFIRVKGEWDAEVYRDGLAAARVIVGNSSAGIIEAPSLGTWAVNVGDRQRGRVRAGNVIDVPAEAVAIRSAILDALQRPRFSGPNPYGDGHASERIRDVLLGMA